MKKLFIASLIMAFSLNAFAGDKKEKEDSKIYLNTAKTSYVESGGVAIGENIGISMPEHISSFNIHSIFVAWDVFKFTTELGNKQNKLSIGGGMMWNKYASNDGRFIKENGMISTDGLSDYSRYLTYSLTLPIEYKYRNAKGVYFSFGPTVNFNVYSSVYAEYKDGYKTTTVATENAYHRPLTVDLRCQIGFKDVGLMFKYSPMDVIKKDYGPQFKSFGIGIVINSGK